MLDTNPTLVQAGPSSGQSPRTPLVLIHDGSGLISNYFWLGSLGRKVYGVHNPHFETGGDWNGGLHEMAKAYLPLIKSVIPQGKILVGGKEQLSHAQTFKSMSLILFDSGWSLGGLVALEIAHLLAEDADITVAGLLLLDTAYPKAKIDDSIAENVRDHFEPPPGINEPLKLKLKDVFGNARRMIREWQPPSWQRQTPMTQAGGEAMDARQSRLLPPPAVLLRAKGYVFGHEVGSKVQGELATVDVARQKKRLGWDDYEHKFIRVAMDIEGHHFNIFAEDKV